MPDEVYKTETGLSHNQITYVGTLYFIDKKINDLLFTVYNKTYCKKKTVNWTVDVLKKFNVVS